MDKVKVAVSVKSNNLNSEVSDIFGRSPYFIIAEIVDGKIEKTEIIENKSTDQMGGAGISAAQLIAEKDVKNVIIGNIGPRASDILSQFNIAIYYGKGVAKDVLQQFIEGKLKR